MSSSLGLEQIVRLALSEDLPHDDITTKAVFANPRLVRAYVMAKEDLVLSGSDVFEKCLFSTSRDIKLDWFFSDGQVVLKGQRLCIITGNAQALLRAERVALNFLGRLSGIATLTRCFVRIVEGTPIQILDTRKTTPLLRQLERKAVKDGGGQNHRYSLSDQILIKDNHIAGAGGITQAIDSVRKAGHTWIEVECQTLEQVQLCCDMKIQRILLDNMTDEEISKATKIIPASIEVEVSGNMCLERVKGLAQLKIHYISVGMLTHSAPIADVSLLVDWTEGEK